MIHRIVQFALNQRFFVLMATVLMAVIGFIFAGIWYAFYRDFDDGMLDDMDRHYLYGGTEAPEAHAVEAGAWGRLFGYRAAVFTMGILRPGQKA